MMEGCCCHGKEAGDAAHQMVENVEPEFKGADKRGCTDIIWIIFFIAGFVALIFCYTEANRKGNGVEFALKSIDYKGDLCENFAAFPSLSPDAYDVRICVDSCDETETSEMMVTPYESEPYLFYCMPTQEALLALGDTFTVPDSFSNTLSDLSTVGWVFGACAAIALACAFFFIFIVQKLGAAIVFLVSLGAVVGGFVGSWMLYEESKVVMVENKSTGTLMQYGAIACTNLTIILGFVLFAMRKKLVLAIKLLEAAADVIEDDVWILAFPLIPFIFTLGYITGWGYIALAVSAVGFTEAEPMPASFSAFSQWDGITTYDNWKWDADEMWPFATWLFFHLLWTSQFFVYYNYLTLSGAVGHWYFSETSSDGTNKKEVPDWMVTKSCYRAGRFHIGSIALGAFILAVINFIRTVVYYLQKQTEGSTNTLTKTLFKIVSCCLCCLKCCIEKLSQQGYAWMGIYGDNFCKSGCASAKLIFFDNKVTWLAVEWVNGTVLFVGKLFVASATTIVGWLIIDASFTTEEVANVATPLCLIFLESFLIGHLFMIEFDTIVDVLFLSMLVDKKAHGGHLAFGTETLAKAIGKVEKHHEKHKEASSGLNDTDLEDKEYKDAPIEK